MRKVLLVAIGAIVGVITGWTINSLLQEPVRPSAPLTFNDRLDDLQFLSATGTWRGLDLAKKVNTVRIQCDGAGRNCDMHQAEVMSFSGKPLLSLYKQSFKVTRLDAKGIAAVETLPSVCVSQTLLVDREAKAVTLVLTKLNREDTCAFVPDEPLTLSLIDGTNVRP